MDNNNSKVKVIVRCRPLLGREGIGAGNRLGSLRVAPNQKQIYLGDTKDNKAYNFDHVFDESCGQQNIYDSCIAPLIHGCFLGFNATVLACEYFVVKQMI